MWKRLLGEIVYTSCAGRTDFITLRPFGTWAWPRADTRQCLRQPLESNEPAKTLVVLNRFEEFRDHEQD